MKAISTAQNAQPLSASTPPEGTHYHIDHCQFIIDPTGAIVSYNSSSRERLTDCFHNSPGQVLRDLLISINTDWELYLPEDLYSNEQPIFLPYPNNGSHPVTGVLIGQMKFQGYSFVSLTESLAPHCDTVEASVAEFPNDQSTYAGIIHRLQRAEDKLGNYMRNFPGVFFSQRADLSFHYIGDKFAELTEYDAELHRQRPSFFIDLVLGRDQAHFLNEINRAKHSGKTIELTYRIRTRSHQIRYILDVRTPLYSQSGLFLGFEGVWLDNTRQSIAENHLSNTAWKESLAILTGGLIHDFSNIMAGIFSLSELYFDNIEDDHPMRSGLQQINKSSQEAQKLVRRIIDLNREVSSERNYHNLENLIKDQLDLMRIMLPRLSKLETNFTESEIPVYIDDVAFRQLLLNMAMNARDALKHEGIITISVKVVPAGQPALAEAMSGPVYTSRDGVEIQFSDNGCGISEDYLKRIFEPFFTTKETNKGSGFGLYNAKLFVEGNQGHIGVKSIPGKGTTFYIYLPIADLDMITDEPVVAHYAPARRVRALLYGIDDPEAYEIVNMLRNCEWEVITFNQLDELNAFLEETTLQPDALIAVKVGQDPVIESLIDTMIAEHPDMQRFVQIRGINPDQIPGELRNKVSCIFDESMQNKEIIDSIKRCFLNTPNTIYY